MSDGRATMRDVSHTPPDGDSVTNVWQRGRAAETGGREADADATGAADDD